MSEMSEEILQGNSREERLKNFIAWFPEEEKAEWDADYYVDESGRHSMTFEEYGFDIQDYSKVGDPGVLLQVYNPPEKPADQKCVAILEDCSSRAITHYNREHVWLSIYAITHYNREHVWLSIYAITHYNREHNTHFRDVHVLKANSEVLSPCRFYITYQAFGPEGNQKTFQTRVNICFPKVERGVEMVRIKPTKINPVFLPKLDLRGGQCSGLASKSASSSAT
nr:PREDICTED: uncharacterized protein LOC108198644 isoform X2 [Daucus carota subsp. sativus]